MDESLKRAAKDLLVANIVVTFVCCLGAPAGIPGIIVSAMALSRSDTDRESARKLLKWASRLLIASPVVAIVCLPAYILVAADGPTN